MAVGKEFREFVLEQLGRVAHVTARSMFGGVGIYADGLFFALMTGEDVYFKVDDTNRGDFEAEGMGPFMPFGDDTHVMQYYQLPAELLEDPDRLRPWVDKSVAVARAAKTKPRKKK
jgi:DNA transformation protein